MKQLRPCLLLLRRLSDDLHVGRLRHLSAQLLLEFVEVEHLSLGVLRPLHAGSGLLTGARWSSLHRLLPVVRLNDHAVLLIELHRNLMQLLKCLLGLLLPVLGLQLVELRGQRGLVYGWRRLCCHQLLHALLELRLAR